MVRFVPYNVCMECGGKLVAIQTETNIIQLDKTGYAISIDNIAIDTKLRCADCGSYSDANITGMRYIKKNSNIAPVIRKPKNPFTNEE
jgi:DNA-directed RNA polymerase subunit RPC12/RpoP